MDRSTTSLRLGEDLRRAAAAYAAAVDQSLNDVLIETLTTHLKKEYRRMEDLHAANEANASVWMSITMILAEKGMKLLADGAPSSPNDVRLGVGELGEKPAESRLLKRWLAEHGDAEDITLADVVAETKRLSDNGAKISLALQAMHHLAQS